MTINDNGIIMAQDGLGSAIAQYLLLGYADNTAMAAATTYGSRIPLTSLWTSYGPPALRLISQKQS